MQIDEDRDNEKSWKFTIKFLLYPIMMIITQSARLYEIYFSSILFPPFSFLSTNSSISHLSFIISNISQKQCFMYFLSLQVHFIDISVICRRPFSLFKLVLSRVVFVNIKNKCQR